MSNRPINESVQHVLGEMGINEGRGMWPDGAPFDVDAANIRAAQDRRKRSEDAYLDDIGKRQQERNVQRAHTAIARAKGYLSRVEDGDEKAFPLLLDTLGELPIVAKHLPDEIEEALRTTISGITKIAQKLEDERSGLHKERESLYSYGVRKLGRAIPLPKEKSDRLSALEDMLWKASHRLKSTIKHREVDFGDANDFVVSHNRRKHPQYDGF